MAMHDATRRSTRFSLGRVAATVGRTLVHACDGHRRPDRVLVEADRWLEQLTVARRHAKQVTVGRPLPLSALLLPFDQPAPIVEPLGDMVKRGRAPVRPHSRA
jgi:hypothetical protein